MRSLFPASVASIVLVLSGMAAAADGGIDSGADASVDASADASELDATPEAGPGDGGDGATSTPSDAGPWTGRPDDLTEPVGDDAGAATNGGCSCVEAGGPDSGSTLLGFGSTMFSGLLGIALAVSRRRRRRR